MLIILFTQKIQLIAKFIIVSIYYNKNIILYMHLYHINKLYKITIE